MDQHNNKQQEGKTTPTQQTLPQNNAQDPRQQAIEQEDDTARLRSEQQSVQDGSGNPDTQDS